MTLTDQLISFWELGEASGTRFDSVVASANNLTDNNTVTQGTGKVGSCGQFTSANSEYLNRADNASLSTGDIDFSVCAWVYFDSVGTVHLIVSKGPYSANVFEFVLALYSDNILYWEVSNGTTSGYVGWGSTLTSGQWYFVVAWHDSVANTLNVQVNNGTPVSAAYSSGSYDSANAFGIGGASSGPGKMNGRIDQVGFGKRVWTADERTQLYNSGNGLSYAEMVGGAPIPVFMKQYRQRWAV